MKHFALLLALIFICFLQISAQPAITEKTEITAINNLTPKTSTPKTVQWIEAQCLCPYKESCFRPYGLERPYICVETRDKELAKLCTCKDKTRHAIYQTTTSSLSPRTISSSKEKREADKSPIATTVAALLIGYFSGILSAVGWCYIFARKSTDSTNRLAEKRCRGKIIRRNQPIIVHSTHRRVQSKSIVPIEAAELSIDRLPPLIKPLSLDDRKVQETSV